MQDAVESRPDESAVALFVDHRLIRQGLHLIEFGSPGARATYVSRPDIASLPCFGGRPGLMPVTQKNDGDCGLARGGDQPLNVPHGSENRIEIRAAPAKCALR